MTYEQPSIAFEGVTEPGESVAPAGEQSPPEVPEETGRHWHAEAGRKGARRRHELIQEGKLYEQEHGLKRGRQRLRQLIELGKLYEQERGLGRRASQSRRRLAAPERAELLTTLVQCLVRIAKPSFREELTRVVDALTVGSEGGHGTRPAESGEI